MHSITSVEQHCFGVGIFVVCTVGVVVVNDVDLVFVLVVVTPVVLLVFNDASLVVFDVKILSEAVVDEAEPIDVVVGAFGVVVTEDKSAKKVKHEDCVCNNIKTMYVNVINIVHD